jgi:hypothetical protein
MRAVADDFGHCLPPVSPVAGANAAAIVAPIRSTAKETVMATLSEQLDAIRRVAEGDGKTPGRIPPEDLKIMHQVTRDQQQSDFRERMPAIGAPAPLFSLPDQDGVFVRSTELLAQGNVVVSFFRGAW